jgi:ribosomal protein L29
METVTIELTNEKAYKILKDLEELNIIKLVKKPSTLSSLRKKIQTKMSTEEIDKQLHNLRDEWQRPI